MIRIPILLHSLLLCFILSFPTIGTAQTNVTLLSNISVGQTGNDVWGYVDSAGIEYAVMGSQSKASIYSLENPTTPIFRATILGPSSSWRDIKSYGDYIYVVTDNAGSEGLQIIDMSGAPSSISYTNWNPNLTIGGTTTQLQYAHNLYIDEFGYGYIAGSNIGSQGIIIVDLFTTPGTPIYVGNVNSTYSHDVFARDNVMYTSDIWSGKFRVYDVANRASPVLLASQTTSTNFTHNTWLSDNDTILYTTDEKANAFVDAYDISDLGNISRLDKFAPPATQGLGVIPHNVHVLNDYLVISYYTDGVVIVDATQPDNLIQVGQYDTWTGSNGGFSGCWGAFPFLPSGTLLASDRSSGLYVLNPTYQRAGYLRGTVRDVTTNAPLSNTSVTILGAANSRIKNSNNFGGYATGMLDTGAYDVVFDNPGYAPDTISVTFHTSITVNLDVYLGIYNGPCPTTKSLSGLLSTSSEYASQYITSDGIIPYKEYVELHANDSVVLHPNFEVVTGASLLMDNDGCN